MISSFLTSHVTLLASAHAWLEELLPADEPDAPLAAEIRNIVIDSDRANSLGRQTSNTVNANWAPCLLVALQTVLH